MQGEKRTTYPSAAASALYEEVFLSQHRDWVPSDSIADIVIVTHVHHIRSLVDLLPARDTFLLHRELHEDVPGVKYLTEVASGKLCKLCPFLLLTTAMFRS